MIPPIDNSGENVIYINPGHISDDLTLFTTLAHEGYPGHLYQTVYYSATKHPPIRDLLSFGGYTEGWATYCEMLSYYYSPVSYTHLDVYKRQECIFDPSVKYFVSSIYNCSFHLFKWNQLKNRFFTS